MPYKDITALSIEGDYKELKEGENGIQRQGEAVNTIE